MSIIWSLHLFVDLAKISQKYWKNLKSFPEQWKLSKTKMFRSAHRRLQIHAQNDPLRRARRLSYRRHTYTAHIRSCFSNWKILALSPSPRIPARIKRQKGTSFSPLPLYLSLSLRNSSSSSSSSFFHLSDIYYFEWTIRASRMLRAKDKGNEMKCPRIIDMVHIFTRKREWEEELARTRLGFRMGMRSSFASRDFALRTPGLCRFLLLLLSHPLIATVLAPSFYVPLLLATNKIFFNKFYRIPEKMHYERCM